MHFKIFQNVSKYIRKGLDLTMVGNGHGKNNDLVNSNLI